MFAAGAGMGLVSVAFEALTDLMDFGVSAVGFEWSPEYLLTDEECDRPLGGLGPSWGLRITAGAAKRGDSGAP